MFKRMIRIHLAWLILNSYTAEIRQDAMASLVRRAPHPLADFLPHDM
jgi:hypothetical protein